jgi:hypothetical protein
MANAARNVAFVAFSVSSDSHTKSLASGQSEGSENTYARIDRHVWHQGAQASTKRGRFDARASASAAA